MQTYRMYIDGRWREAASGEWFETHDPCTAQPWARLPRGTVADVDEAVAAAQRALRGPWRRMTATQRGALLRRLGDLTAQAAEQLAVTEVRDNGKLLAEMRVQTRYMPEWFYYYGGLADKIEGSLLPTDKPGIVNYTQHEPLGVVAAIVAWNSPLLLAAYKLAPALAAGNTVVLKPSEFSSCSALEWVRLVEEAGFPPGVINVVTGFGSDFGDHLVRHPGVAKVAFTGSDATGRRIYAGAAESIKRVSLELGGKSPNIVFADADLDSAVNGAIGGIFAAGGQTCVAGSRLLVQRAVLPAVLDRLVAASSQIRIGHPMEPATQMGPISTRPQFDEVLRHFDSLTGSGLDVRLGGRRARVPGLEDGWFLEPTIVTGMGNDHPLAREEIFGPLLCVLPFDDEEEALAMANDTRYGLAAGVWTQDYRRMFRVASALEAGTVWINTYRAISYLSPFGGYKQSGVGREMGMDAIREYLQVKSVWISTAEQSPSPFVIR